MRIQRVATKQGHPVPMQATYPQGPFPPELFRRPTVVADYVPQSDGGGEEIPDEGTAQNNYRAYKWYRCRDCEMAVREDELELHECEGSDRDHS